MPRGRPIDSRRPPPRPCLQPPLQTADPVARQRRRERRAADAGSSALCPEAEEDYESPEPPYREHEQHRTGLAQPPQSRATNPRPASDLAMEMTAPTPSAHALHRRRRWHDPAARDGSATSLGPGLSSEGILLGGCDTEAASGAYPAARRAFGPAAAVPSDCRLPCSCGLSRFVPICRGLPRVAAGCRGCLARWVGWGRGRARLFHGVSGVFRCCSTGLSLCSR